MLESVNWSNKFYTFSFRIYSFLSGYGFYKFKMENSTSKILMVAEYLSSR
jgi:hypothetical protein